MSKHPPRGPKRASTRHSQPTPIKFFSTIPLPGQVRLATPIARQLILEGIDTYTRTVDDILEHAFGLLSGSGATEGAAPRAFFGLLDEDQRPHVTEAMCASLALGIAIGQLVRPAVFEGAA